VLAELSLALSGWTMKKLQLFERVPATNMLYSRARSIGVSMSAILGVNRIFSVDVSLSTSLFHTFLNDNKTR
jgi:hypothetical protein